MTSKTILNLLLMICAITSFNIIKAESFLEKAGLRIVDTATTVAVISGVVYLGKSSLSSYFTNFFSSAVTKLSTELSNKLSSLTGIASGTQETVKEMEKIGNQTHNIVKELPVKIDQITKALKKTSEEEQQKTRLLVIKLAQKNKTILQAIYNDVINIDVRLKNLEQKHEQEHIQNMQMHQMTQALLLGTTDNKKLHEIYQNMIFSGLSFLNKPILNNNSSTGLFLPLKIKMPQNSPTILENNYSPNLSRITYTKLFTRKNL